MIRELLTLSAGFLIGGGLTIILFLSMFGRLVGEAINMARESDRKARFWHGQYLNVNKSNREASGHQNQREPDRSDPDWWRKG